MQAVKRAVLADPIKACIQCESRGNFKVCTVCHEARYCSPECQKADWQRHKIYCGKKTLAKVATEIRKKQPPIPTDDIFKLLKPLMEKYRDPDWNPFPTEASNSL